MLQVNRDSSLKMPKQIEIYEKGSNSVDDTVAVKKAIATANDKKLNTKELKEKVEIEDKELEVISRIPSNSNDLIVITVVKKLELMLLQ